MYVSVGVFKNSWTKLEITLFTVQAATQLLQNYCFTFGYDIYFFVIEFNALRTRVVMSTLKVSSEPLSKYILDFVGFYYFLF